LKRSSGFATRQTPIGQFQEIILSVNLKIKAFIALIHLLAIVLMDPTLAITRALGLAAELQEELALGGEAAEALERIRGGVFGAEAAIKAEATLFKEYLRKHRPPPSVLTYWAAILDEASKPEWGGPPLSRDSARLVFEWVLQMTHKTN
jgi:hypothetical protein